MTLYLYCKDRHQVEYIINGSNLQVSCSTSYVTVITVHFKFKHVWFVTKKTTRTSDLCKDRKPTVLLENYNHLNKLYNSKLSMDQYHIIVTFYYVGKQDYMAHKYVQVVTLNSAWKEGHLLQIHQAGAQRNTWWTHEYLFTWTNLFFMSLFNHTHNSFYGWPDFNEDEVVLCSAYCQLTDLVIPRIGFGLEKGPKMLQENSDFKILT